MFEIKTKQKRFFFDNKKIKSLEKFKMDIINKIINPTHELHLSTKNHLKNDLSDNNLKSCKKKLGKCNFYRKN